MVAVPLIVLPAFVAVKVVVGKVAAAALMNFEVMEHYMLDFDP
tara:strand:- start:103 stop:231 length:129 start_codon:yes stop_codon:yes gene_type:complete